MSAAFDIRNPAFGVRQVPPKGNANFARPRKYSGFIHHLAPRGMAGFVLASSSMSSTLTGEGEIKLLRGVFLSLVKTLPRDCVN